MDFYLGNIMIFGFNFAPRGWQQCNGQVIAISQNQALFALLGTTFGGNGTQTFGIPGLQGRAPVHMGQGPGLSNYVWGELGGVEALTLTYSNLPMHNHTAVFTPTGGGGSTPAPVIKVSSSIVAGSTSAPSANNNILSASPTTGYGEATIWAPSGTTPDITLGGVSAGSGSGGSGSGTVTVANAGGSTPVEILNPYLALNFCIALTGVYPTRS